MMPTDEESAAIKTQIKALRRDHPNEWDEALEEMNDDNPHTFGACVNELCSACERQATGWADEDATEPATIRCTRCNGETLYDDSLLCHSCERRYNV